MLPPLKYLTGYPADTVAQVQGLIASDQLSKILLKKYPDPHEIRSDKALYDYVLGLKNEYLRGASISRVQGGKLKAKREIRVAAVFKEMPEAFLRMIVVHELAHLKERQHDKAFYQLCQHMAPDYFQLEFDLRAYLCHLDITAKPLWSINPAVGFGPNES
jgi:hypothetical protein